MITDSDQDKLVEKLDIILADYDLSAGKKGALIVQLLRLFTGVHRCNCELCQVDPKP